MSVSAKKESTKKGSAKDAKEEAAKAVEAKAVLKAEEPVKKTPTKRTSKKAEAKIDAEDEAAIETETEVKSQASAQPKKRTSRKSKDAEEETENTPEEEEKVPVKKPVRKSKKAAEEPKESADENLDVESKVYKLIKNSPDGVYQNEIWKNVGIDSRKCSRILKKLLDSDQIVREEAVAGGTKTYLLKNVVQERQKNYNVLMVKETFSPCTGCSGECRPEYCPALTLWIMNLHEKPEDLYTAMGYSRSSETDRQDVEMLPEFIEETGPEGLDFDDGKEDESVYE